MGQIIKGIPIPPEVLDGSRNRLGGHKPLYPFREMDVGDLWEERVLDKKQRTHILTALRNAKKSKPDYIWVWSVDHSSDPEKARTKLPYMKIWRVE